MKKLISLATLLAPFAIITLIFGTVYGAVQQDQRSAANDPQIQIAEDGARTLSLGRSPSSLVAGQPIVQPDLSLAPFYIVFDDQQLKPIASNVILNGEVPIPPRGVFENGTNHGKELRFTWQPTGSDRFAAVLVPYSSDDPQKSGGFVLVARSLKEVEQREQKTQLITLIGWALSMFVTAVYLLVRPKRHA